MLIIFILFIKYSIIKYIGIQVIYMYKTLCNYFINWLFLLLNFWDFYESFIIGFCLFVLFIIFLFKKGSFKLFYEALLSILKLGLNPIGFIYLMIFTSYYYFIIIKFEEKINLVILFFSVVIVIKDFYNITRTLSFTNKKTFTEEVKPIIFSVFIIFAQQIVNSLHLNIDTNYTNLFLSLLIIPIYLFYHSISKFFINYEKIMIKYEEKINFDSLYFLPIYFRVLICFRNYEAIESFMFVFLQKNNSLTFSEMKEKIIFEISKEKNNKDKKSSIKSRVRDKAHKKYGFHLIFLWSTGIILLIYYNTQIILNNYKINFVYILLFLMFFIGFIINIFKEHTIKCQFDFIIYLILDIIIAVFLIIYYFLLSKNNFVETNFLIPIFIYFKIKNYHKKQVNFLLLPFKTEYNFFNRKNF